jgi:hypothetical protein
MGVLSVTACLEQLCKRGSAALESADQSRPFPATSAMKLLGTAHRHDRDLHWTVSVAGLLVALPTELLTVTVNTAPLSAEVVAGVV